VTLLRRRLPAVASVAVAALLLGVGLPRATGVGWRAATEQLEVLTLPQFVLLIAVWLLGLYAHTFLSTAALPELTHRRALTLNLSGSAVSNLLPFGGALGMSLNYAMIRSWGHAPGSFGAFTALTTMWNVVAKLALPVLAIGLLATFGELPPGHLALGAVAAGLALLVVLLVVTLSLLSDRVAAATGTAAQRVVVAALRLVRSRREPALDRALLDLRARSAGLLRRGWGRMLLGMATYAVLQVTLLWLILHMLGSSLGLVYVFAGFAFGRLLTLLVVTPGGVGIAETGSAALLVALGGDAGLVAAATVLYTAITFALEIPVGGLCGLLWWRRSIDPWRAS